MNWKKTWSKTIGLTLILMLVIYTFIILVDPYDSFSISIPAKRVPIVTNQRFSYPAIARDISFDSLVIGTSTTRLLNPDILDLEFDTKFANLSMNSATAYEQYKIYDLFSRNHDSIKYMIIGVDTVWCDTKQDPDKYTFRPFPPWLYDDNKWNDYLYMFNDKGLENSVRLIEYWMGKREPKYAINGYRSFVDFGQYDPGKVVNKLYGSSGKKKEFIEKYMASKNTPVTNNDTKYTFPIHNLMGDILRSLDNDTVKIILFVPYHYKNIFTGFERFKQCKNEISVLSSDFENIHLVDFMFYSDITTNDSNYWDPLHYRLDIAEQIPLLISRTIKYRKGIDNKTNYIE
jgi:hypothetical protein